MQQLFRLSNISLILCVVILGVLLFRTSQSVQDAENRLGYVVGEVHEEKESLRMLDIEWSYLNNPERLERLAERYTNLVKPSADSKKEKHHKKVPISTKDPIQDRELKDLELLDLNGRR